VEAGFEYVCTTPVDIMVFRKRKWRKNYAGSSNDAGVGFGPSYTWRCHPLSSPLFFFSISFFLIRNATARMMSATRAPPILAKSNLFFLQLSG